jgi:hypothetical protein
MVICAALLVSACASDTSFVIAGRKPNPKAFEEDASACSGVGSSVEGFLGGALGGVASGAYLGAVSGAGRPEATLVGAAGGAVLGLVIGAGVGLADSFSGDNYDLCMVRKGYQVASTEGQAAPTITRPARLNILPEPVRESAR